MESIRRRETYAGINTKKLNAPTNVIARVATRGKYPWGAAWRIKKKTSAIAVTAAYQQIANSRQLRNSLGPNGGTLQKEIA